MGLTLTESATFPATLTVPVATELVSAESGAGGIRPVEQGLANRTRYLLVAAQEQLGLSLVPSVRLYTESDRVGIDALGTAALWLDDAQSELVLAPLGLGQVSLAAPGMAGWHHVYLYWDAGGAQPLLEVSTVAPDAARAYKSGAPSRRYLGSVQAYDPGGGAPLAWRVMRQDRGHVTLATPVEIVHQDGTGAWETANCTGFVPSWVRSVDLRGWAWQLVSGGSTQPAAYLQLGSPSPRDLAIAPVTAVSQQGVGVGQTTAVLSSSQTFTWKMPAAISGGGWINTISAIVSLVGWHL